MRLPFATCLFWLLYSASQAFPQTEKSPEPLQVPPETVQPLLVKRVAPVYPPLARQARIQGTVILNVVINKSGEVEDVKLIRGHPLLAPAAIQAVKQWRYRPYEKDGEPVEIETTVQVNFKLADNPPVNGVVGSLPGGLPPNLATAGQVHLCDNSAAGTLPNRVRVSEGVMRAMMISKRQPEYPNDARNQGIEGIVLLALEIGKNGSVCDIALISGHPLLAPAAIDTVRQWKYRSYLLNGVPIEVETQAQVNFRLAK